MAKLKNPRKNLPLPGDVLGVSDAPAAAYLKAALYHAKKICRNPQDAEEVAADSILAFLEAGTAPTPGLSPIIVMKRPVIGAVRKKYGAKGTDRSAFNKALYYSPSLNDEPENNLALAERLAAPLDINPVRDALVEKIKVMPMPPITRGILLLELQYGFTDVELSRCFGFSPTWILQLKRQAFAHEPGAIQPTAHKSRATEEIRLLQERVRHLEIVLQAKGIKLP